MYPAHRTHDARGWCSPSPAADDCPDSVFIEDTIVVCDGTAVITRPGAPSRRPETDAVEATARELGLTVARIEDPGTLDGGDVLQIGHTLYVGLGGRTNAEGIRQLGDLLAPLDRSIVAVPVTKVLHLKSAITALPDGSPITWGELVDRSRSGQLRAGQSCSGSRRTRHSASPMMGAWSGPSPPR